MNNNGSDPGPAAMGRFDFVITPADDHVSVSRPVTAEDVAEVRRWLAERDEQSRHAR